MSETQNVDTNYIGYEYKEAIVPRNMEGVWVDGYVNFGWELVDSKPAVKKAAWGPIRVLIAPLAIFPKSPFAQMVRDHDSETETSLRFRRSRDIENKSELNRAQFQFETYVGEIANLERSKTRPASITAYSISALGAVFMAASVFSFLANMIPLTIVMGILGFAGWILPYFIHNVIRRNKTQAVEPRIEDKYDTLHDICRKANSLLHVGMA